MLSVCHVSFYNELVRSEQSDNVIWYCNGCKKVIPGVRKVLNTVTLIHTMQESMNERLQKLEDKVQVQKPSDLSIECKLDQAMYDFKERDKRKNNVIIYNLPEPVTDDYEDRNEQEGAKISKICECAETACGIESASRLGEKRNDLSKPRPLKVVFSEEQSKYKLLKNSQKLKTNEELKKVSITPDYTFRQRQINNAMKSEVSRRRLTDSTFNYRKLKHELQNQGQSAMQSQSEANLPSEDRYSQGSSSQGSKSYTNPSFRSRSFINSSSPLHGRPFECSQSSAEPLRKPTKVSEAAEGRGPPLGRGSGTMGSRR